MATLCRRDAGHVQLAARPNEKNGVRIVVSTDAHAPRQLANMRLGIAQARRGWLERGDVVNTRSLGALRKLLQRRG